MLRHVRAAVTAAILFTPTAAAQGATPAGAAEAPSTVGDPDSVSLRFGWPAGMAARVEQQWTRVQSQSGRTDSTAIRTAYRMRVAAHPDGRLVEVDSFEVLPGGTRAVPGGDAGEALMAQLGSFLPSYVVSEAGEFARLADPQRLHAAMDALLAPMRKELESAPPQLRELFANATSAEALTRTAAQEWNLVVGTWVGADWEVGSTYEYHADEPIPLLPGKLVPMNYEFAALERVPCTDDAPTRECVLLAMRSEPDAEALAALLQEFFAAIAPEQRAELQSLRNMRTVNELTVVTDPRTLQPYSVELVKLVEVGAGDETGAAGGVLARRVDRRATRYHYAGGATKD